MPRALIVVDCQVDFCEDGSLPVPGGNAVAENIVVMLDRGVYPDGMVFFTRDTHSPQGSNGGHFDEWPEHCVAGTDGAELHPALRPHVAGSPRVFFKGWEEPAYSGFQGKDSQQRALHDVMYARGVTHIDVCGIAAEYCVLETALDSIKYGYYTRVLGPDYVAAIGGTEKVYEVVNDIAVKNKALRLKNQMYI